MAGNTDEAISRGLTPGEQRIAATIFGISIDYGRVLIHNRKAYFFQPADTAITPNGEVYFPPSSYKADFSKTVGDAAWLVHELTHVYQHQHGMWVRTQGLLHRKYDYGDLSQTKRTIAGFLIEQQASIVEDYFKLIHHAQPTRGTGSKADYERVITFLPGKSQ